MNYRIDYHDRENLRSPAPSKQTQNIWHNICIIIYIYINNLQQKGYEMDYWKFLPKRHPALVLAPSSKLHKKYVEENRAAAKAKCCISKGLVSCQFCPKYMDCR